MKSNAGYLRKDGLRSAVTRTMEISTIPIPLSAEDVDFGSISGVMTRVREFAFDAFHFARREEHSNFAMFEQSEIRAAGFPTAGKAKAHVKRLRDRRASVIGGIELDAAYTVVNQYQRSRVLE